MRMKAVWNFVIDTLWRENRKNQMNGLAKAPILPAAVPDG